MITEKNGNFISGSYTAIPYQHNFSSHIWEVIVWKNGKHEKIRVAAPKAIDAAVKAIDKFDHYRAEREEVSRLNKMDKEDILEEDEDVV